MAPDQNEGTAIRFRIGDDLELLLHVMGYPEIFGRGTMKLWDDVAEKVRKAFPTDMAGLRGRTCRERTIREIKAYVVNNNKARRKSGTEEEYTRKDELLAELSVRYQAAEDEKRDAGCAKKKKAKDGTEKGKKLREDAVSVRFSLLRTYILSRIRERYQRNGPPRRHEFNLTPAVGLRK